MIILGYILFSMLALRFAVVLANRLSAPWLNNAKPKDNPLVSVLIPARNEEHNLPKLIGDLEFSDYENIEIIVCNDQSTDGTEAVLNAYSGSTKTLRYFNNTTLPVGWIGKNYACHRLAGEAVGDYLLFLDADVRLSGDALSKALAFAQKRKLALLSVFPQQIIESAGEWETVPLMNWILLSFLPLPLVQWRWFSSLSAANGQFMLFEGASYRQNQWHQIVKDNNVEDIRIARLMKKKRLPIAVKLGNGDVLCRMYTNGHEAINGFARNINQYFGGSRVWMVFYLMMVWLRLPFFVLADQFIFFSFAFIMIIAMKALVSSASRQPIGRNLYEHGAQMISLTRIVIQNLSNFRSRQFEWKGRKYHTGKGNHSHEPS